MRLPKPDLSITVQPVGVADTEVEASLEVAAYPNPFSSEIMLAFRLPKASKVQLEVIDLMGKSGVQNGTAQECRRRATAYLGRPECAWNAGFCRYLPL
jgi:hypothetical protein